MSDCCRDFSRSQLLRSAAARAGSGLPEIEPGMPTPAGPLTGGGRGTESYLPAFLAWAFAYFCWNFATRPAVSRTRCLPV